MIQEQSFNTDEFRPKPLIHVSESRDQLFVLTPWGDPEGAKIALEAIQNYLLSLDSDEEVTAPIPLLANLSATENHLRAAIILGSEQVYNQKNSLQYTSGFEIFAAIRKGHEIAYVQVGHPLPFLVSNDGELIQIGINENHNIPIPSHHEHLHPPMAKRLLGIESNSQVMAHSFKAKDSIQIVLLSHDLPGSALATMGMKFTSFENLVDHLSQTPFKTPFWAGYFLSDQ